MTIVARKMAGHHGRLNDRARAGELLRPLLRRACTDVPVIVGIGAGGLAVAANARGPRSPVGALGVEEFDLPDPMRPCAASGAVSSTGRTLLRMAAFERLDTDPEFVRRSIHEAEAMLGASLLPLGYTGPELADRQVVLVDDGTSSCSRLSAALDFVRRGRPASVLLALACAPMERIRDIEEFAGDVVVADVPSWTDWFHWHGRLYESDRLPGYPEVRRLLRPRGDWRNHAPLGS